MGNSLTPTYISRTVRATLFVSLSLCCISVSHCGFGQTSERRRVSYLTVDNNSDSWTTTRKSMCREEKGKGYEYECKVECTVPWHFTVVCNEFRLWIWSHYVNRRRFTFLSIQRNYYLFALAVRQDLYLRRCFALEINRRETLTEEIMKYV